MNGSHPAAAFDRLREAFRSPGSFGGPPGEPPDAPPAASIRVPPADPEEPPRFDPGLPGVRVLTVAGLLAALVAGGYLWWSRPAPQAAPAAVLSPAPRAAAAAAAPGSAAAVTPSPSPSAVTVDVAGKVRHPGVVTLPAGARVIDAIRAAGGLRPGSQPGTLNLARPLSDGEQILVGVTAPPGSGGIVPPQGAPPPGAGAGTAPSGAPLDLNTATAGQLDQLPGVGPVLAQRIVDYRTRRGSFRSVDELRQVSGIGPAKFDDIKGLVRV